MKNGNFPHISDLYKDIVLMENTYIFVQIEKWSLILYIVITRISVLEMLLLRSKYLDN